MGTLRVMRKESAKAAQDNRKKVSMAVYGLHSPDNPNTITMEWKMDFIKIP